MIDKECETEEENQGNLLTVYCKVYTSVARTRKSRKACYVGSATCDGYQGLTFTHNTCNIILHELNPI